MTKETKRKAGRKLESIYQHVAAFRKHLFDTLLGGGAMLGYAVLLGIWIKLLGNVSFNPVSALTVSTADRLIQDRQVKDYMINIMREVLAIGRAVGVDADIDPEARIDMARALGKFKTSMLQDLEAGKSLEIDGLLAGTLEIARKAGVKAPYTESLFGLIKARAQATGRYR